MEEWKPNEAEEPDHESAPSRKKRSPRRVVPAFMQYLESLRHRHEQDDDDEAEEADPKQRRSWRLGRFLRGLMSKPEGETKEVEATEAPQAQEAAPAPDMAVETQPEHADSSESGYRGELIVDHGEDEDKEPAAVNGEPVPRKRPAEAPAAASADQEIERQEPAKTEQPFRPVIPDLSRQNYEYAWAAPAAQSQEVQTVRRQETRQPERIIERRGNIAVPLVAVAAEHIGRKRADRQLGKRIDNLDTRLNQAVQTQNRAEQVAERQEQRTSTLESRQDRAESVNPMFAYDRTETAPVHRMEPARQAPADAEQPQTEAMRQRPEVAAVPDTDRLAEMHARPDVVLEQVARAAEQDIAVEKVYERRQEVRDEPGRAPGPSGGGAQPVGAVMAKQYGSAPSSDASPKALARLYAQLADNRQFGRQPSLYKQAAAAGVAGAGAILVFGLIAALLLR